MLETDNSFSEANHNHGFAQLAEIYPELLGYENKFFVVSGDYSSLSRYSIEEYQTFLFEKIRQGKKIIFNVCAETILTHIYERIHEIIEELPTTSNVFFSMCGALDGEEIYQQFAKQNGYKKHLQIICYHHFEKLMYMSHKHINSYTPKLGLKNKLFLCFNKIERYHRLHLYAHAIKNEWLDKSFFSFQGSIPEFLTKKVLYEGYTDKETYYPYMEVWVKDILEQNKDKFPLVLNITETRHNPLDVIDEDLQYFENSYLSLVTETLFYKKTEKHYALNTLSYEPAYKFLTEKTFKPIIAKHPFILVGYKGFLDILKERGYKTFHPFINETYDTIDDDYERMNNITNEILRLKNFTENEWLDWQNGVKNIVEHNYTHFFKAGKSYKHTSWNENWIK
jgi:hypothetical protein